MLYVFLVYACLDMQCAPKRYPNITRDECMRAMQLYVDWASREKPGSTVRVKCEPMEKRHDNKIRYREGRSR